MKSNHLWLINAGLGLKGNRYTMKDALSYSESVHNRAVADKLLPMLDKARIRYVQIQDQYLKERVSAVNRICAKNKRCFYLSMFCNEIQDGPHKREPGTAFLYTPKVEGKDWISSFFCAQYLHELKRLKLNSAEIERDIDHEVSALDMVKCPNALVQTLLFKVRKRGNYLATAAGTQKTAEALFSAIQATDRRR